MNSETANLILDILVNAVQFYSAKRMLDFLFDRENCRLKHMWILCGAACVGVALMEKTFGSSGRSVVTNLAVLLLMTMAYRGNVWKRLLYTSMIYTLNIAVLGILVFCFTGHTYVPSNRIYECAASLVVLLLSVVLEKMVSKKAEIELPMFYRGVLGVVPFTSLVSLCYLAMTESQQGETIIFVSGWILIMNLVIYSLHHVLAQFYLEKIEKNMFEQMVNVYAYQLELAQESQDRIAALRHDMKHHMMELALMIKEEENPDAVRYLKEMNRFMLNPREYAATGNKELDGVLNYLLRDAKETLEHVNNDIRVPEKSCWKDFTLCVILGNLLDNAIREAKKSEEKYLEVHIRSRKGILLMDIENSYSGEIQEENHRFQTTQNNAAFHGIGLENVKRIVWENRGEMDIHYENNRFHVKVLLYENV